MSAAVLLLALAFAPAPVPKPAPPAPAIEPCAATMLWSATLCETHFHADGAYSCFWNGRWWTGRWSQAKGVLSVEEWPAEDPSSRYRWGVKLACPRSGVLDGGRPWRLSLLAGRID